MSNTVVSKTLALAEELISLSSVTPQDKGCQDRQFFSNRVTNAFLTRIDRAFLQIRDLRWAAVAGGIEQDTYYFGLRD